MAFGFVSGLGLIVQSRCNNAFFICKYATVSKIITCLIFSKVVTLGWLIPWSLGPLMGMSQQLHLLKLSHLIDKKPWWKDVIFIYSLLLLYFLSWYIKRKRHWVDASMTSNFDVERQIWLNDTGRKMAIWGHFDIICQGLMSWMPHTIGD